MTNKHLLVFIAFTGILLSASAQKKIATKKPEAKKIAAPASKPNPWIFTYGKDTVYQQEFERLLTKNRKDKENPSKEEISEYLELYQNFKMKVKEAKLLQLDTFSGFKSELAGYRKQLANPYLTDKKVTEGLIKEAYERTKLEINASHILINCAENASPKDTLAAYNKILELRKRITKGETFEDVAKNHSEDPSASRNNGNLGWFSAFYMIYPFETQSYTTPKGQVSMPFRTKFGYHIVKVIERRPARGEVKVAHIMIQTQQNADETEIKIAQAKTDSIYKLIIGGESFEKMAKDHSSDMSSNQNGGVMNFFNSFSNFPENFKDIAFNTEKGEVTKPFRTDYGWHILKVLEKKPVPELAEMEESLKNKISRDSRSESSRLVVAQRIKKENKYLEYPLVVKEFTSLLDSNFNNGNWEPNYDKISDKVIVSINDKKWTMRDFANYVRTVQEPHKGESVDMIVLSIYKKYTDEKALEYEEVILETKYEDFKNLMQEYNDGIMLFDLTDKKVWTRAVTDTAGLEAFHQLNNTKYMWKERLMIHTVSCLDEKTKIAAMKMAKSGKSKEDIGAKFNKKLKGTVVFEMSKHEKGSNNKMDLLWSSKGVSDLPNENNTYKFIIVDGVVGPEPKTLKEAKGMVTSDYQNHLEKEWLKEMRSKYPVSLNQKAIDNLFK